MKIATAQGPREVTPVKIASASEATNTYMLEDGSTINVRLVVAAVYRLTDPDEFGQPIYQIANQALVTSVPATQSAISKTEN